MNCSCAAERCPHLQYLRTLLENSRKDQVPSPPCTSRQTSTSDIVNLWDRWKPHIRRVIKLSGCAIETVLLVWVALAQFALQLWLRLLNTDRSAIVLFLFFTLSVISSPAVRGA